MKSCPASFIALSALLLVVSGCEKPAQVAPGKTVATVEGEKISETELNLAVSRLGDLEEAQAAEARSRLLQALIDQRLIADAAEKAGLHKEPAVDIAMAQASRQVLAEAYAERHYKDVAKPTEAEIAEYYNAHPELFSQRRVFRIQEIELKVDPSRRSEVEAKLQSSRSMGDFVNWIKEQGIEGKTAVAVKPAEQIPTPLLARLAQMRDGQVTILPGRPGYVLVQQLQESQSQPVSLEQAQSAIERALTNLKRKDLMETDLKKLRETAKIDYESGYAPAVEAPPAAAGEKTDDQAEPKPAE